MTQTAAVYANRATILVDLPDPESELLPGVQWGAIDAFPTPAYWAYQVFAKRILGRPINYKLGMTLKEEVGACLLGGHGIPGAIGIAAFEHMRNMGAFFGPPPSEAQIHAWLSQPLPVGDRHVRYRFVNQKSRYLAAALAKLDEGVPSETGRALRDWLVSVPGIGYKTASWIARNWLRADDVAILDIHILRAGRLAGVFPSHLTVERHYLDLESRFLDFSTRLGIRPSELDAVIWLEMADSPNAVHRLMSGEVEPKKRPRKDKTSAGADNGHANTDQTALFV